MSELVSEIPKKKGRLKRILKWTAAIAAIIILAPIAFFFGSSYFPTDLQVENSSIITNTKEDKIQYLVRFSLDEKLSDAIARKPVVQVIWATLRSCRHSDLDIKEVAAQRGDGGYVVDKKRVQYVGFNQKSQRHDYTALFDAELRTRIDSTLIQVDAQKFEGNLCFQLTGGGMSAMVRSNKILLRFGGKYATP
jgi:hypothetical protein